MSTKIITIGFILLSGLSFSGGVMWSKHFSRASVVKPDSKDGQYQVKLNPEQLRAISNYWKRYKSVTVVLWPTDNGVLVSHDLNVNDTYYEGKRKLVNRPVCEILSNEGEFLMFPIDNKDFNAAGQALLQINRH